MTVGELTNLLMLLPNETQVVIHDPDTQEQRPIISVLYLRWPHLQKDRDQDQVRIS